MGDCGDVRRLPKQRNDAEAPAQHSTLGTVRRYRAATQHLENYVRSQARPAPAHQIEAQAFLAELPAQVPSPDRQMESQEWWEALVRAAKRLSPREQTVMRWRVSEAGPLEELADSMGCTPRTLRRMVRQARDKFALYLEQELD